MKELHLEWEEFKHKFNNKEISPKVDINLGHALMKSELAPSSWRITIKIITFLTLISFPTAIILFFFVKWWIPIIIIVVSMMFINGMRREAAQAVVEESIKNEDLYYHAIDSKIMRIFTADNNN